MAIQLIVGLGNPGKEYQATRHNAGTWFLDQLIRSYNITLNPEKKFHGAVGLSKLEGHDCYFLQPSTYMNESGLAVAAIAKFYKIEPSNILIIHDELDLPVGTARLKQGGGHGGHNGLKDIINRLGSRDFWRLRIGISHPGHKDDVVDYVLQKPSRADKQQVENAIDDALRIIPNIMKEDMAGAQQQLHTQEK